MVLATAAELMSLSFRPSRLLRGLILLGLVGLPLALLAAPQSAPPAPAEGATPTRWRGATGANGRWVALREQNGETEVVTGQRLGPPITLARGAGWAFPAVDGNAAWIARHDPAGDSVLRLDLTGGTPPSEAVTNRAPIVALTAADGRAFWIEQPGPSPGALSFVPAALPNGKLFECDSAGSVRLIAEAPLTHQAQENACSIIGVSPHSVLVQLHQLQSTEIVRFDRAAGGSLRLLMESGTQTAVLAGETLLWTAPSEESTPHSWRLCVRRVRPGGVPETIAEWLPGGGMLMALREGVYYAGNRLHRLPDQLDEAEALRLLPSGSPATDGEMIYLFSGARPTVVPPTRAEE